MKLISVIAMISSLSFPVFAQQAAGASGLDPRLQWEAQAPWGQTHLDAIVEAGKLVRMNPTEIDVVRVEPFKMFDNLYYVGIKHVSAFLITTSEGLVLLDALLPDTTSLLFENIRKAGFRAEDIKYVLISHSHPDHFGGAGAVKEISGARVVASLEDWQNIEQQQAAAKQSGRSAGIPLTRDIVKGEGDTLKVGDQEFKFYFTPGHAPGSLSAEFRVIDRGKSYRALSPGGLGTQFGPDMTEKYLNGIAHLKALGPWDVIIADHPFYMLPDMAEIRRGVASLGNGPHPLVSGPAKIDAWFDGILKVVREKRATEQSNQKQ